VTSTRPRANATPNQAELVGHVVTRAQFPGRWRPGCRRSGGAGRGPLGRHASDAGPAPVGAAGPCNRTGAAPGQVRLRRSLAARATRRLASKAVSFLSDNIWHVANFLDIERVRGALEDLCEPLHDVFGWADMQAADRMPELGDRRTYGWYATHTVRALAHHKLGMRSLGAWRLSGNHARNGELWLTDGQYRARVLHALSDKQVPPPGLNVARCAYYRNSPLALFPVPLFGPVNDRLLLLWRIDPESHEVVFRVVRPIGDWKWGDHALTDLDFILPQTAVDLHQLQFLPTDEGLELDIPAVEGGAEDATG
jgi:hypothetical protein